MPAAAVYQARIVIRLVAASGAGIGRANGEMTIAGRKPVGTRVGAEERVEGPVLLHDHDDMLDLVYSGLKRQPVTGGITRLQPAQSHDRDYGYG